MDHYLRINIYRSMTQKVMDLSVPSLDDIVSATQTLDNITIKTPHLPLVSDRWNSLLPAAQSITLKLELFQQAGSFKARGAYLGIAGLSAEQRSRGVVAASGGNHAIAVSWAALAAGVKVKIAMPVTADPRRVQRCNELGATVILCDDITHTFDTMAEAAKTEGMNIMHPFEARHMILGAATCGWEFAKAHPEIDLYVVPVGGGGLISGMALAIKLLNPAAQIVGVEPYGADSMWQSFAADEPVGVAKVDTIADSLGAPFALPYSFGVASANVDEVVRVTDDELRVGMDRYRDVLNILAEPACAATLAALTGPLAKRVENRHVGLIACGSNIGLDRYRALLGL